MNKIVSGLRANSQNTFTENGANTNQTSLNAVVDLFFLAGASRSLSEKEIISKLTSSWLENKELTLKLIFWAGDIRNGAGERRFFQISLKWLYSHHKDVFLNNIHNIPQFNRWDSLFFFYNSTEVLSYIQDFLEVDGLLAKWMPREGKSKHKDFLKAFLAHTKLSSKTYRQLVVKNSNTVEQQMSSQNFKSINYSHVPSIAFNNYKKSFIKHDKDRFSEFLEKVKSGTEKINAGAIFPYQIYQKARNANDLSNMELEELQACDLQWNSFPNYLENSKESILPVCDTSGSMSGLPYDISVSLGMYFSERNHGAFKDAFITFSEEPTLQYLKGTLSERMTQFKEINAQNTNLQKVFETILDTAVKSKAKQSDLPSMILIISDMEFDEGVKQTPAHMEIKEKFKNEGFKLPKVVYWNVNAKSTSNYPITINNKNVALVSGSSPSVIQAVLGGKLSVEKVLLDTLLDDRYSSVVV